MAKSKIAEDFHENESGVTGQYKHWFLDYASYVILERAVPAIEDGLKPVQRRILHAMKEMDDGRFNKVANIIGQSMQYHPHGDASIGEALVNRSLEAAKAAGWTLIILVGDESYYARMGFQRAPKGQISLPGPVDPDRLVETLSLGERQLVEIAKALRGASTMAKIAG